MKDYRNRLIKEGDVLLLTYNRYGIFEVATLIDGRIRTLNTIQRAPSNFTVYLLENPTTEEIAEKDKILQEWHTYSEKKKQEKKQKKNYGTKIGCMYTMTNRDVYLYLGNLHITDYDENGNVVNEERGNYYYRLAYLDNPKDREIHEKITTEEIFKSESYRHDTLKCFKTVSGLYGMHPILNNYGNIVGTYDGSYYNYSNQKVYLRRVVEENTEK